MLMMSITPSKLRDYLICPLKYKFKHLDKNSEIPSSSAFSFGTSIHKALQRIHRPNNTDVQNETPAQLLERFWEKSAYDSIDEERQYFIRGCHALENYIVEAKKSSETTLGTEVYLSLVISVKNKKLRLGCRIDRLALHPDGWLEIIDYKTNKSGKIATVESLIGDLPAFLYFVLTRLSYPQYLDIRLSYLNVLTMEKSTVIYEKTDIDENKRSLWKCLNEIVENIYVPRSSENCSWCDFQDQCPLTGRVVDFEDL